MAVSDLLICAAEGADVIQSCSQDFKNAEVMTPPSATPEPALAQTPKKES